MKMSMYRGINLDCMFFNLQEMECFLKLRGYEIGFEIDRGRFDRFNEWDPEIRPAVKKGTQELVFIEEAFINELRLKLMGQ